MPKRVLKGKVFSNASDKTIMVLVERREKDSKLGKTVLRFKKFMAHDESNNCKKGDLVEIIECKPISKKKTWMLHAKD